MFCPKCGQPASGDKRFCSRCGFRLDGVSTLLVNDGALYAPSPEAPVRGPSPRQKGVRLGAKLMLLTLVLMPLIILLCVLVDEPVPLIIPATLFLTGLARLLYAAAFEEGVGVATYVPPPAPVRVVAPGEPLSLPPGPPQTGIGPQRVNTAEMAQPPSVTDHTTRVLDKSKR